MFGGIDLVKQLNWMNVMSRWEYFECLFVFKCIHGMAPRYLTNNITMEIEIRKNVNTRTHDMNVQIPFPNSETGKKRLHYSGGKKWNVFPGNIK